jgi:hypothetical protein
MHDQFFEQRSGTGELGHSTFQKVITALRMMAYGISVDLVDVHLAMSESQASKCVKCFAISMVEVFGSEYFRTPNCQDTARLLEMKKKTWVSSYARQN